MMQLRIGIVAAVGAVLLAMSCSSDATSTAEPPPPTQLSDGSGTLGTTTSSVVRVDENAVVLRGDGLGFAVFGDDAVGVESGLVAELGDPDERAEPVCEIKPTRIRETLRWGDFRVEFLDGAFSRWTRNEFLAPPRPDAPTTAAGVGIGSTAEELKAAYPGQVAIGVSDHLGPVFALGVPSPLSEITGWLTAADNMGEISYLSAPRSSGCDQD